MKAYVSITKQHIIFSGTTPYGHDYIVYLNPEDKKIHVNAHFYGSQCCMYYDRILCNTLEELETLSESEIQNQAYNAWMDGAHS